MSCTQEVVGSNPTGSTVAESEVVEELVCETSISEFESRQSPQLVLALTKSDRRNESVPPQTNSHFSRLVRDGGLRLHSPEFHSEGTHAAGLLNREVGEVKKLQLLLHQASSHIH